MLQTGIRKKYRTFILTAAIILALGIIVVICSKAALQLKKAIYDEAQNSVCIEEENLYNMLNSEVEQAIFLADSTANSTLLQHWIERYDAGEESGDEIIQFLENLVKTTSSTNAVIVSSATLDDYTDLGFNKTLSILNDHDSWYFDFIESGAAYALHVDTEETRNDEKMLFINHRINSSSGTLLGVFSVGVSFASIDQILRQYSASENMSIYLVAPNGSAQFVQGEKAFEDLNLGSLLQKPLADSVTVLRNASGGYTTVHYMDSFGWDLVTYKEVNNVNTAYFRFQMNASLLLALILMVCAACIMAAFWQRERQKVAELSNKSKTDFLSRMSHDIRTPLNGIMGMLHIAQANMDNSEKLSDALEKIGKTCHQLELLINDVLEMSRIDSGRIELSHEEFCLPKVLNELAPTIAISAEQNAVRLTGSHFQITHEWIMGSPMHLQRIILNLLSNAVKYNRTGGSCEVWCTEVPTSDTTSDYIFKIQDTGIGMSAEFQKHMFEPFSREKQSSTVSGTGLGLAITKELIELMHGTIRVESQLAVGTSITVTLPFEIVERPHQTENAEEKSIAGMHILMAEDNALNAEIAIYFLQENNATVVHAADGKEVVSIFESSPPGTFDVILMDLMMPVMDGYEAARALRELPRQDAKTIPIVAMSANAFAEDVQHCLTCGMNDHFPKPIDPKVMINKIYRYKSSLGSRKNAHRK